jgi:hypothetical protein
VVNPTGKSYQTVSKKQREYSGTQIKKCRVTLLSTRRNMRRR